MNEKKYAVLLVIQILFIAIAGITASDAWYAIGISFVGVVFNFLVSLNISVGFLFGVVYALTNGILSYETGVYATAFFMIFIQAPMAVYSFISWRKKKEQGAAIMKKMDRKYVFCLIIFMIAVGIFMYFVLGRLNSANVLFDDIFFVCSLSACFLLALCYKNAYIITLFSGIGGTILWTLQMIQHGSGISVAAFYLIVAINSMIAVYDQYIKGRHGERMRIERKNILE